MRTARETGSVMRREHSAPARPRGAAQAERRDPDPPEPVGFAAVPDVPGRTGVTFGYWKWRIMVLLKTRFPRVRLCHSSLSSRNLCSVSDVERCSRRPADRITAG